MKGDRRRVIATFPCHSTQNWGGAEAPEWAIEVEVFYVPDNTSIFGGTSGQRGFHLMVAPRGRSGRAETFRVASGVRLQLTQAARFTPKQLELAVQLATPTLYLPMVQKVLDREKDLTLKEPLPEVVHAQV